jgi:hypothetical protein
MDGIEALNEVLKRINARKNKLIRTRKILGLRGKPPVEIKEELLKAYLGGLNMGYHAVDKLLSELVKEKMDGR